ncbi:hypothetical protein FIBSPDRAFT_953007 [Athelia psychrophila]|uniref:RNI-like protein n=1 Tax=Athelia psychrophila TaxID=1759441 RepID=A0A166KZ18_9AGAM|nr:hypothetical protein FIBSPDRAFT_953007 [Fibularhizoctonia sp. CBS 109695]
MKSLWYGLFDIVPLLNCFPEDVWEVQGDAYQLRRPLLLSDWTRFLHHADHVRSFGTSDDNHHANIYDRTCENPGPVSSSAYHALEQSKPREQFFPNLRRLHWRSTRDPLRYLRSFVGPKMTEISLAFAHPPNMAERSLLTSLSSMPLITSFSMSYFNVDGDRFASSTTPILNGTISSWERLQNLDTPSTFLTTSSLMHIALLPNLQRLNVGISPNIDFSCLKTPIFPDLRSLGVYCDSISKCNALLQMSPLWTLEEIRVTSDASRLEDALAIGGFFNTFHSRICKDTLRSIKITNLRAHPNAANNHFLNFATLAPLLSFPNLEDLMIMTPHSFDLDNNDLLKLAISWPRWKQCTLGSRGWGAPSKITPMGLAELLTRCSHLTHLSLAIDASVIDYDTNSTTYSRPNKLIRHISLQDSRIEDPNMVAAFLSDLLSELSWISAWSQSVRGRAEVSSAEAEAFCTRWKETEQAAQVISEGRERQSLIGGHPLSMEEMKCSPTFAQDAGSMAV